MITNAAHVTGNENDPDPSNNDDSVDTPVKANADVEITKTASPANPVSGDTVTYTLKAKNNGPGLAANVVVTDVLPAGVSFVSADSPCTEASGTVTLCPWHAGRAREVTLEVKVTVDHWGDTDPSADHLLDVQKVENQIDLNRRAETIPGHLPSGYFATDGSVRIDEIDQGTGDWTAPQVPRKPGQLAGHLAGTVRNTAAGRAQAKIFAVCVRKTTGDEAATTTTCWSAPGHRDRLAGPGQQHQGAAVRPRPGCDPARLHRRQGRSPGLQPARRQRLEVHLQGRRGWHRLLLDPLHGPPGGCRERSHP